MSEIVPCKSVTLSPLLDFPSFYARVVWPLQTQCSLNKRANLYHIRGCNGIKNHHCNTQSLQYPVWEQSQRTMCHYIVSLLPLNIKFYSHIIPLNQFMYNPDFFFSRINSTEWYPCFGLPPVLHAQNLPFYRYILRPYFL